jgi:lipopolysaccharide transport system permease protein
LAGRITHFLDVIQVLVHRDFVGRYRNTLLGMVWGLVSPCLFLLVFYFVFTRIFRIGIERYATFTFIGILAWTWFQASLVQAVSIITSSANLVAQPRFPIPALPIVAVIGNLINLVIALPVLLAILLIEGGRLSPLILYLPVLLFINLLLNVSLSYFLAAWNVFFRDVQYIVPAFLQLGYYVSPIFYDAERVPVEFRKFMTLNPMYGLIEGYRDVILRGVMPDWGDMFLIFVVSALLMVVGYLYFKHASYRFLEDL